MGRCGGCGAQNGGGARFCNSCGTLLAAPAPERRKLATAVFCDLSGSTALGERVDAEVVFGLMRSYFESAQAALERHGGSVEKFIGDAVVGVFGVPEAHEDDALRACRAALEIQERVATLNGELESRYGARIAVRIGINTGEVVTGEFGTRAMFPGGDSVVLGDAMNVAARLEQAAAPGEVLIGDPTWRLVRDIVEAEPREAVQAKGKSEPLAAYRLVGVVAPGHASRPSASPHAGRGGELAVLVRAFDEVEAVRCCRLVTVVGEPGIGKSRLAAELLQRISGRARVARAACLSYGEGITYWAISEVVRELVGIREDQSLETARAGVDTFLVGSPDGAAIAAQIAQLLGLATGSTTPEELAWAVRKFLTAAAAEQPLVVVVDDIQWGERVLLDLVAGLPPALPGLPVLVLCLARPELLEREPAWPVTVRLAPLGADAVDALLASLGAPPGLREKLVATAAGNPLFVEELVATLADQGLLAQNSIELDAVDLPVGINALVTARLDRLEAGSRDALERGAIEGEIFHRGAVVDLSEPTARESVPARLDDLTSRDFIRPGAATVAGEVAFRFKHILVREAAYRATAKRLRAPLHERFADWLERLADDRVAEYQEILGYHLEQAYRYRGEIGSLDDKARGLGERAATHLAAAAWRAEALSDYDAVANLLERALAIGLAEPHSRVRVQAELGSALGQTRRVGEADAILTEAYETAAHLGERGIAAGALVRRGWNRTGDPKIGSREQQSECEGAILTLSELGDERGLADARRLLALALDNLGRPEQASTELELALASAEASGDAERRRSVINSLVNHYIGGPTPVREVIGRCEELSLSAGGDRVLEATLQRSLGILYAMDARPTEALDALALGGALLDEVRLRRLEVHRPGVAYARQLCGDADGAERELLMSWDYFRDMGGGFDTRAWGAANRLASLYCDEGRVAEAAGFHAYGREEDIGERQHPLWLSVEARLVAHEGRLDVAAELAKRSTEDAENRGRPSEAAELLATAARVERAAGRTAEAETSTTRALALFEGKGNLAGATRLRAAFPQLS
jgi:class 3 adenylate cyclase/tetratricopeptide (TPR) repeat protein